MLPIYEIIDLRSLEAETNADNYEQLREHMNQFFDEKEVGEEGLLLVPENQGRSTLLHSALGIETEMQESGSRTERSGTINSARKDDTKVDRLFR